MGLRVRWIREAYEAREPFQHSQAQWAASLGITPEMLNRIELGKHIPHDVVFRVIYRSGASLDYLVWGVLEEGRMLDWLYLSLKASHRAELVTDRKFREIRSKRLLQTPIGGAVRISGRGRERYARKKTSPGK